MAEKSKSMVEAVVQRGIVVWGSAAEPIHSGPGEKVTLEESEVIALRARGVLVDPRNGPPPVGIGPKFGLDDEAGPVVS